MSKHNTTDRTSEKGNVLFLILIAVALFAALSYAVTQSSRSGGGDANSETNLVNSAAITQYPASIRTAIIRQIVSKNVAVNELEFNSPSDFGACTNPSNPTACVFHPAGGGATYTNAPADIMASGNSGDWHFNGENEINLVGTTDAGADDNPTSSTAEIIAFLPGIKEAVCTKINEELGVASPIPVETNIDVTTDKTDGINMVNAAAGGSIGGTPATLDGQGFGCFELTAASDNFVYYHVLIEQ